MNTNEVVTVVNLDKYLKPISRDIAPIIKSVGDVGIILSNHMKNLPIYKNNRSLYLPCEGHISFIGSSSYNIHGETQTSLDVYANMLFRDSLMKIGSVKAIVSEEDNDITMVNEDAIYTVAYDPIDGSSNIDLNIPIGSIFAVYDTNTEIVMAGYILYGTSTVYVLAINKEVTIFALDDKNQWVLTQSNVTIPTSGVNYSINEGNEKYWTPDTKRYIAGLKDVGKYSLRYIGSMVADIHRTLLVGGIFIYPSDTKNSNGKLRQLYEVNPMSYIIEAAGGVSYTGRGKVRCLDVPIVDIHQKCPIFIGSVSNVDQATTYGQK